MKKMDLFIVIFFLLIAVFSLELFRRDLLRTINVWNVEPAGAVVIKKNTVQRRLADRVLWDRLRKESPVYIGDLIRVAEVSAATLFIEDNTIDLDENTLIRITRAADGKTLQIVLGEGNLSLAAGKESGNVSFEFNGMQVHARPGTVLNAASSDTGGIAVQVNEGDARLIEAGGAAREIVSGSSVMVDADGRLTVKMEPVAVVAPPRELPPETPLPIPLLPSPQNLSPAKGTVFGLEDFRSQRSIVFDWSAVREANAYIFTLYQQAARNRRQILRVTINSGTRYTLTNLRLLDRGTFVWQVEAVNTERHGVMGESMFIIDFPASAPLQIENEGILYGN